MNLIFMSRKILYNALNTIFRKFYFVFFFHLCHIKYNDLALKKMCLHRSSARVSVAGTARVSRASGLEWRWPASGWYSADVHTCALTILCFKPIVNFAAVSVPALVEDKFDDIVEYSVKIRYRLLVLQSYWALWK